MQHKTKEHQDASSIKRARQDPSPNPPKKREQPFGNPGSGRTEKKTMFLTPRRRTKTPGKKRKNERNKKCKGKEKTQTKLGWKQAKPEN